MVLCCWVSMACFPSAGSASEPLAEAPDVGRGLVCDGPRTQGVFRTSCLLVSQCYCEHFCQDIWNGARSPRLHTQLFPGVPSNTAAAVFLCVFKHSAHVVPSLLSSLNCHLNNGPVKRSLCAAPPLREPEKRTTNFRSLHACERRITL